MAFVFTLSALLRVREIHEKAALQTLRALASQAAAAQSEMEALDASMEEARREVCERSLAGVLGAELHFYGAHESAQRERRQRLVQKLRELEKARQKQQAVYLQARQKREVLSSLREKQLAAYNLEESRRTQRGLDELHLLNGLRTREERETG